MRALLVLVMSFIAADVGADVPRVSVGAPPADTGRHLRVRGAARIDGHAGQARGRLLVTGRVVDDAGIPVPNAPFSVSVLRGEAAMTGCGDGLPPQPRTDESGRFCVWATVSVGEYRVHVDVPASDWLAHASADYAVDLSKRSVELRFDPEPRVISLDGPRREGPVHGSLDAIATSDDGNLGVLGLPLELVNEAGGRIEGAVTDNAGRASFTFDLAKLGPPGLGAVVVRFAGDADTMATEHAAPIERDVHVKLTLPHDLAPGSPEDGVTLEVDAVARAVVPTGSVEARVDNVIVGAAPLAHGHASVLVTFLPRGKQAILTLRYVPDVPWLQPSADTSAVLPVRGPSPWRQAPLAVGALVVTAWLLLGRNARRRRLDRTLVMSRAPEHEGTAGIAVVHSSRTRTGKFEGKVVDAHDGSPVARARLAIETPSFREGTTLLSVFANDEGAFEFELDAAPPDAELRVEAPLHAELRQKLPPAGILEIALVSRRRRLLEQLVQWAKRRGPPYDQRLEPTPAQVRRAADGLPEAEVAAWATAVERAAFDKDDVDARVERDVNALEPRPRGG